MKYGQMQGLVTKTSYSIQKTQQVVTKTGTKSTAKKETLKPSTLPKLHNPPIMHNPHLIHLIFYQSSRKLHFQVIKLSISVFTKIESQISNKT